MLWSGLQKELPLIWKEIGNWRRKLFGKNDQLIYSWWQWKTNTRREHKDTERSHQSLLPSPNYWEFKEAKIKDSLPSTEIVPGGARDCLSWLHKALIQNMWGQQSATLGSPRPTGECVPCSSCEVKRVLIGEQGLGGRVKNKAGETHIGGTRSRELKPITQSYACIYFVQCTVFSIG